MPLARTLTLPGDVIGTARGLAPRVGLLLAAGVCCLIVALFLADRGMRLTATVAGITLCTLVIVIRGLVAGASLRDRWTEAPAAAKLSK